MLELQELQLLLYGVEAQGEVMVGFSELIEGFVYDFEAMMERSCLTFH